MYIHIYIYIYVYINIDIPLYTYVHIYIYIYTYIYTGTPKNDIFSRAPHHCALFKKIRGEPYKNIGQKKPCKEPHRALCQKNLQKALQTKGSFVKKIPTKNSTNIGLFCKGQSQHDCREIYTYIHICTHIYIYTCICTYLYLLYIYVYIYIIDFAGREAL